MFTLENSLLRRSIESRPPTWPATLPCQPPYLPTFPPALPASPAFLPVIVSQDCVLRLLRGASAVLVLLGRLCVVEITGYWQLPQSPLKYPTYPSKYPTSPPNILCMPSKILQTPSNILHAPLRSYVTLQYPMYLINYIMYPI